MTAGDDSLFVSVGGRDMGLEALLKKVDAEMQVSADRAVKLGQSYARLAQAQGQPTAAAGILAGTMQRAGAASEQSLIGISTQAARLQNSSQGLQSSIAGLGGQLSQLGGTAGQIAGSIGNLAGSFGTLGGIGAAIGLGKVAIDLSVAGANADLVRQRFDGLAESAGTTGNALLAALQKASGGEIDNLSLELASNRAQILGVAKSAEEMSVLLSIARDRAQQLGTSSSKAFDDLVTGLGRGSPLILDNLGIMVSVKEANDQYAASLGKTAAALTEAEQKQALINAVLAQGRASLAETGGAVASTSGAFQQFNTNLSNIGSSIGSFLSIGLGQMASQFNATVSATQGLSEWFSTIGARSTAASAAADAYAAAIERGVAPAYAAQIAEAARAESLRASAAAQAEAAQVAVASTGPMAAAAAGAQQQAIAAQQGIAAMQAQATAIAQSGGAYNAYAQAANQAGIANQAAAGQINFSAQAMQQSAEASVLAAAQHQAQAAATAALTAETNASANAFLALNPNIDAAGIASAVAAGRVPPLVGQLAALMQQAQRTAGAMAQLAAQQAGVKGVTALFNTGAGAAVNFQGATSGAFGGLAGGAPRNLSGDIKFPTIKPPRGGGGGGGTRLSDQQKLQNSLLASQEDYQQKSEDAATQHAIDVEKINRDFYAKMQAAQRDFDQSQLDGRAGVYDQLGQIESDKIRQAASQQYEAASQEAGRIAQEKGADVAEKYMSAQEQIISARAKRLADIEKAEKDKDTGKAEYLKGVDNEYKKAEDARLARIQEGEGSVAAERQKQLDDAAAKEADAQDKISLAADRASDKKILASERAGKAIDAELAKAGQLADTYDRVGNAGSRAGITPAAGAATTPPVAAPPAAGAAAPVPAEGPSLAELMSALLAKLESVVSAEKAGADQITSAIRRIGNTGNIGA